MNHGVGPTSWLAVAVRVVVPPVPRLFGLAAGLTLNASSGARGATREPAPEGLAVDWPAGVASVPTLWAAAAGAVRQAAVELDGLAAVERHALEPGGRAIRPAPVPAGATPVPPAAPVGTADPSRPSIATADTAVSMPSERNGLRIGRCLLESGSAPGWRRGDQDRRRRTGAT